MSIEAKIADAGLNLFLKNFVAPFVEKAKGVIQDKWQQFDWLAAEQTYRKNLIEQYGSVRVLGKSHEIPLRDIFTDVYILDEPTAYRRYNINKLMDEGVDHFRTTDEKGQRSDERLPGLSLVHQDKNLYILGKPGAGKTTFLKHVAIQGANNKLSNKLPIFVSLHDWANSEHDALLPYIVQQFDICKFPDAQGFVEYLLAAGKGLLLFDGLDEVRKEGERRLQVTRLLQNFTRKYDRCQHLITCRVAASDYTFKGFSDVEVADFTQDQIKSYAEKWFSDNPRKYKFFVEAIEDSQNQGVQELCNVPILLSLICLYFDDNLIFPQRRSELYEDALDVLLRRWDSHRAIKRDEVAFYGRLTAKRKQQMLAHIAARAFEKGLYFFKGDDLGQQIADYLSKLPGIQQAAEDIDGEAVLKEIAAQHGLLIERANNIYSFSHLTFQEFFTAKYIVENEARGTTQALIKNHLADQRWREVFFLVASMLDNGDGFCQHMRIECDNQLMERNTIQMMHWCETRARAVNKLDTRHILVIFIYMSLAIDLSNMAIIPSILSFTRSFSHFLHLDDFYIIFFKRSNYSAITLSYYGDTARLSHLRVVHLDSSDEDFLKRIRLENVFKTIHNLNIQVRLDYGLHHAQVIAEVLTVFDHDDHQEIKDNYATNFSQLLRLCHIAGAYDLENTLSEISVPQPFLPSSPVSWQKLADQLSVLMKMYRDLRIDWSLDQEDMNALDNYFYANELLIRCLDMAFIIDRQAFKDGLLLPPGEWKKSRQREELGGMLKNA